MIQNSAYSSCRLTSGSEARALLAQWDGGVIDV